MSEEQVVVFSDFGVVYRGPEAEALRDVAFALRRGEMVAVLGASNAGKSTLLKCVNRLVPELKQAEIRGDLHVLGRDARDLRVADLAGRVGFVFQDFEAQLFSTNVQEEMLFGLEQLGIPPAEMAERVRSALAAVGLAGFERRDPTTLSGGEKQRLAIGAVLALRPELWLLDEPSTDLDPTGREELFELLGRMRGKGPRDLFPETVPGTVSATLLVVEHDVEAVTGADRWLVLRKGEVALEGRPVDLLAEPDALAALGVRPPELARVCHALGLPPHELDVDAVAAELRGRGVGLQSRPLAASAPSREARTLLEVRGIRFRYEGQAVDALAGVDFVLREGEFVALLGANGSGKSTLARLMTGILRPGSGDVLWRDRRLDELTAAERAGAVGYVFQNPDDQIFAATVEEEIAFGPMQMGWSADELGARVRAVLVAVDLCGLERRDPFLLGKGERQRTAVASILALRPEVLILDEPTTGLDFPEQKALMDALARLNRSGQTIVMITHVPWVVAAYARRAMLLQSGEKLWDGPVRELFANEELCRRGGFLPPEVARLAARLGGTALTVEELLDDLRGRT
ncbi:MAG: ABC transporter ATP-binding protein [Candidatus Binatia bacterium]